MKISAARIISEWMDLGHEFGIFQSWLVRLGSRTEPVQFYGLRGTMHWQENESFHAFLDWSTVPDKIKRDGIAFILSEHCDYHKQGGKLYKPSVWYMAGYTDERSLAHSFLNAHYVQFRPTRFDIGFHTYQHVEVSNVFTDEFEVLQ